MRSLERAAPKETKPKKMRPRRTYKVIVKGTKLTPRRSYVLHADTIARNVFGDLILRRRGYVVASWNREQIVGVYEVPRIAGHKKAHGVIERFEEH